MRSFISRIPTFRLLVISFVGLGLCRLVDKAAYGSSGQFDRSPVGMLLIIVFSVVWCGTLLVVGPLQLFYSRESRQEVRDRVARGEIDPAHMSPVQQHLFYANYGSLPRWLYLPFVIIAIILGSFLALGLVLGAVATVWTHVFGT